MSPEQATGDRVIDGRTDVYSLAAMTYEMLTGEPPHSGTTAQAIIAKLMTTAPQPVRTLRASVPPNVAMAVEHGLAKLPADRFATAKGFAEALTNSSFTTGIASAATAPLPARASRTIWMLGALSAALLVAAAWGWLRPAEPKPVSRYALALDSTEALIATGRYGRIALSPDGSMLVYIGGPRNSLMLRRREELQATPIPGTEQSGAPFFSPDGRRVGFIQNAQTLRIATFDGSPPITVGNSVVGLAGLSWGADDMIYADGNGAAALVRVAARAGAKAEHFTVLDTTLGERDQVYPHILPGDNGVLYMSSRPFGTARGTGVAIMDPKTGARRIVIEGATRALYTALAGGRLVYTTTDGNLMAAPFDLSSKKLTGDPVVIAQGLSQESIGIDFALSRSGTLAYVTGGAGDEERELVWMSRDGKAQRIDSMWHAAFTDPAISPDGTRLAVSTGGVFQSDAPADIWIKRLESGALFKLSVEGGFNRSPAWSRDGKVLRYTWGGADTSAVVEKRADNSAAVVRRFLVREVIGTITTTADDQWFVYSAGFGAASRIYARRAGDTTSMSLFPGPTTSRNPVLSPDGKWLAYVAVEGPGPRLYVSPFPNVASAKWLVSPRRGGDPVWSNRGTEIFYREPESQSMLAVPVSTSPTFSFGTPKVLFPTPGYLPRFAVSPDDSKFLMVRRVGGAARERLTIVENWDRDLGRKR
jgi:serine/threonine-protein kinase